MAAVWLLASRVLGRPVPVVEGYPHICGERIGVDVDQVTPTFAYKRDCVACFVDGWLPPAPAPRPRRVAPAGRY